MKLILAASGLFVALMGIGIACGPTEKFCYKEGKTCAQVAGDKATMMMQSDASDAAELGRTCIDPVTGKIIECTD